MIRLLRKMKDYLSSDIKMNNLLMSMRMIGEFKISDRCYNR